MSDTQASARPSLHGSQHGSNEDHPSRHTSVVWRPRTPMSSASQGEDWAAFDEPGPTDSASHKGQEVDGDGDGDPERMIPRQRLPPSYDEKDPAFHQFDDVNRRLVASLEADVTAWVEELGRAEVGEKAGKGSEEVQRVEMELRRAMGEYYKAVLLMREMQSLQSPPTWLKKLLSAMCAIVFLVGGMVGLYFVASLRARLGMVAAFTVLFAFVIALATKATRQEVFVATAAYAAVLVVFVSGNIANDPQPTVCTLQGAAGANVAPVSAADAISSGVTALASSSAWASATSAAVQTVTASATESVHTVFSTVMATVTVTAGKQKLSGISKAGIVVGIAVGALIVLLLLIGVVVWGRRASQGLNWGLSCCVLPFSRRREKGKERERSESMYSEDMESRSAEIEETNREDMSRRRDSKKAKSGARKVWV